MSGRDPLGYGVPDPRKPTTWPLALQARPRDLKRKLPIPAVNMFDTQHDFTAINGPVAEELALKRLCGLCGNPFEYWIAFIGGPLALLNHFYSDPPMHPECAKSAMSLCPYILIQKTKRAPDVKTHADADIPLGTTLDKPDKWFLATTREYVVNRRPMEGGGFGTVFHAGKWRSVWTYAYDPATHRLVQVNRQDY